MAPDDRDRTFEKALARHLRSSASSGVDSTEFAAAPAPSFMELCPDPETLAAYYDDSLSLEERNLWKKHVVGCDRCQLVLAHLGTPLEVPANLLDQKENVPVQQQPASSAAAASPARTARSSPLHSLRWLWLVPAGAIAAGLVAWVSLETPNPNRLASPSPVEIAENRQPAQPPVATLATKPALAVPREPKSKDQAAAPSVGGAADSLAANRDLDTKESQNQLQAAHQAPSQNAVAPAHGPSLSQQRQEQQINRIAAGNAGAANQKKLDAPSNPNATGRATGALAARPRASSVPPPPPPAPPESSFIADDTVPPLPAAKATAAPAPLPPSNPSALESSAADKITNTASGASPPLEASAAPQSLAKTRSMMRAAALESPRVFGAPGGRQFWRIGAAGSLEHSKDKGLNWTPQISGVYTDLLAGSAPSEKVCWIVGAFGTILRTTDGGNHWTKLDSPVANDLTGIRAEDATHAWVWFVADQPNGLVKMFQTSDGGLTWVPASDQ